MPPTAAQRQQIAAFSSITSVSEKLATKVGLPLNQHLEKSFSLTLGALQFLKNNGWKVDAAMDQ